MLLYFVLRLLCGHKSHIKYTKCAAQHAHMRYGCLLCPLLPPPQKKRKRKRKRKAHRILALCTSRRYAKVRGPDPRRQVRTTLGARKTEGVARVGPDRRDEIGRGATRQEAGEAGNQRGNLKRNLTEIFREPTDKSVLLQPSPQTSGKPGCQVVAESARRLYMYTYVRVQRNRTGANLVNHSATPTDQRPGQEWAGPHSRSPCRGTLIRGGWVSCGLIWPDGAFVWDCSYEGKPKAPKTSRKNKHGNQMKLLARRTWPDMGTDGHESRADGGYF